MRVREAKGARGVMRPDAQQAKPEALADVMHRRRDVCRDLRSN